jgi:hypothetical protein
MSFTKLAAALSSAIGKKLDRVIIAGHSEARFQLYLVFTDGTYYEFYGRGTLEGARAVDRGSAATLREMLTRSGAQFIEIPKGG